MSIPYFNTSSVLMPSISTAARVADMAPVPYNGAEDAKGASFADFLEEAIANTVSSDYLTKRADLGMLLGEAQDLHTIGLAGQQAEIMLNLTVQIRDRVIEAYQDIMRMQI